MEMYKKPVMEIVELEKVDVLTASCPVCHTIYEGDTCPYVNDTDKHPLN